jgi:5'-methylthioadenosine phosphorylase
MPRLAVIGGTGFYEMSGVNIKETVLVETEYGEVRLYICATPGGHEFAFLPRHGEMHSVAPHRINYRANIKALQAIGVERIIGVSSVGSLRKKMRPGDFVFADQFLDFTKCRPSTFFEEEGCVVHTDMTEPYCPGIRASGIATAGAEGIRLHKKGTYACTEGPRFETPAEIRMFAALGADVVGMTGVPECVLAKELGMCYACLCVVTNYAAGISGHSLSHEEVIEEMEKAKARLQGFIVACLDGMPENMGCKCRDAPGRL